MHTIFKKAFEIFLQTTPGLPHKLSHTIREKEEAILSDIFTFFISRLRTILGEYGFEKDEIEASLAHGLDDTYDLFCKLEALHAFRKTNHAAFLSALEIYTRTKKILFSQNPKLMPGWMVNQLKKMDPPQNRFPPIDPLHFKDESEKHLFQKIQVIKHSFHTTLIDKQKTQGHQWKEAFALLTELQAPLNNLFDRVKIIDDEAAIRTNRLALLQEVWDLCEELIDFSKIQEHSLELPTRL